MKLKHLLFFAFFVTIFTQVDAQVLSYEASENTTLKDRTEATNIFLVDIEDYIDWTFFINAEEKILFIDFESLNGKAQSIQIIKNTEVKYTENLEEFPMNTFYELNLQGYQSGFYTILIETTNEIFAKEFIVE